jgi:hypothetical protein
MKLEKFNLEKALNGAKVVTRDGREVLEFTKFENIKDYPLVGVLDSQIQSWTIEGNYLDDCNELNADLFIEGKVKSVWINIYKSDKQNLLVSGTYKTKETALNCILTSYHYIKTIEITDEP